MAVCLGATAAVAADDLSRELDFASGLVEMGFPDFAERLLDRLGSQNPDLGDRIRPIQVEILLSRRRFEDAEKMVSALPQGKPSTDAAWLAIANGKFQIGEIEAARKIYQSFFDRMKGQVPEDPDIRRFYMDASYRFGQMLERAGDLKGAAAAWEKVLLANPSAELLRRMQYELAVLYVRVAQAADPKDREPVFKRIRELCEKIQWGEMDLWFGKSIIPLAQIELIKGDGPAAEKLVRSYLDILNQIETMLTEQGIESSLSPLAGARYLLGDINHDEAKKIEAKDKDKAIALYTEALKQYVNVFARYADSEWGMDAGAKAGEVQAKLESLGKTIKINWGDHAAQASSARFRLADDYFAQKNYAEAEKIYLQILNRFPDNDQTPHALSNLLMCQVMLDENPDIHATAEHIAERYAQVPDAGLALLIAGRHYFEADRPADYTYFYDRFIRAFPRHPRTPSIAYTLASLLQRKGDTEGQRKYLDLLIRDYDGDPYQFKALSMLAWNRYVAQDYEGALLRFQQVVEKSPPSHERAVAEFTRADCLMRLDRYPEAVQEFQTLLKWLATEKNNPYGLTSEEIAKNREFAEKAKFFSGYCLARTKAAADALPALRESALRQLNEFLTAYPKSDLAARAMSVIGGTQLELSRTDDAAKTFEELAKRYPDSDEGRNALYSLIRAAVDIGKLDVARDAFKKMMAESAKYGMDQILRVSQSMLDSKLYEEAFEGFQMVIQSHPTDRAVLERSLFGMGRSAYETKRYDLAVEKLKTLTDLFQNTGLLFDAKFALARSLRELGRLEEAVEALRDVFERATDKVLGYTANLELARMQKILAERAATPDQKLVLQRAATASYQRVALFGDKQIPEARPLIQEALLDSIRLFMAMGSYGDAIASCDQFLQDFPESTSVSEVRKLRADANLKK